MYVHVMDVHDWIRSQQGQLVPPEGRTRHNLRLLEEGSASGANQAQGSGQDLVEVKSLLSSLMASMEGMEKILGEQGSGSKAGGESTESSSKHSQGKKDSSRPKSPEVAGERGGDPDDSSESEPRSLLAP